MKPTFCICIKAFFFSFRNMETTLGSQRAQLWATFKFIHHFTVWVPAQHSICYTFSSRILRRTSVLRRPRYPELSSLRAWWFSHPHAWWIYLWQDLFLPCLLHEQGWILRKHSYHILQQHSKSNNKSKFKMILQDFTKISVGEANPEILLNYQQKIWYVN